MTYPDAGAAPRPALPSTTFGSERAAPVVPRHCRLVSRSVAFTPAGRTTVRVLWHLDVEPVDERSCVYTNRVTATATDELLSFIARQGISLDQAREKASGTHTRMETPLFARSIERHALAQLVAA